MEVKELYAAPTARVLHIRVEGVMCVSTFGSSGQAGATLGLDNDDYDYGDF